jgi:hypothetical protein
MGQAYSKRGSNQVKVIDDLEDVGKDGKIILKWVLEKQP